MDKTTHQHKITYDESLWREYSRVYDEVLTVIPYKNLLSEVVEVAEVKSGMRLLDACCGTGNLLLALDQHQISCHVTGADRSKDMLAKAQKKLEHYRGEGELVRTNLDAPVNEWGIKGKFDRFIFNNCLAFISDPRDVIHKSSQLANPGAILVASTPRPNPNINELLEEQLRLSEEAGISREETLRRMTPTLQPILSCNERLMRKYGDNYHLPSIQQLEGWFKDSEWEILDIATTYAGQNWLVKAELKS